MRSQDVEDLYVRYGHRVFGRCRVLVRDEASALDLTQEVFVRALDRLLRFGDDRQALAWLLRVATNLSLNELRRRRTWRLADVEELPPGRGLVEALVEDRDRVRRILARTRGSTAQVGVGYFLEGRTAEEIARELAVSVPTVRRRIRRFLERARALHPTGGAA